MSSKLEILYLDEPRDLERYLNLLSRIGMRNPYYTVEFFEAFSSGLENLIAFCWYGGGSLIILPGYVRDIERHPDLKDFTSPYGYSGPLFTNDTDQKLLIQFWEEVKEWMESQNIISSFIRFSLNMNYCGFPGEIRTTLSNIRGKILSPEEQWSNFDRKVRKNVNTAKEVGLSVKIFRGHEIDDDLLEEFHSIYYHTLERAGAHRFYFFDKAKIQKFVLKNNSLCVFAFAYDKSEIISTEMILVSGDTIFSFLGGTKSESFPKRPNDLLKYEIICWAEKNKFDYYVLGGGYRQDDGIFRFKRTFFPDDIVSFNTGWHIINGKKYTHLVREYNAGLHYNKSQMEQFKSIFYFPEYRKPVDLL